MRVGRELIRRVGLHPGSWLNQAIYPITGCSSRGTNTSFTFAQAVLVSGIVAPLKVRFLDAAFAVWRRIFQDDVRLKRKRSGRTSAPPLRPRSDGPDYDESDIVARGFYSSSPASRLYSFSFLCSVLRLMPRRVAAFVCTLSQAAST
jgi:hypothetical protein